MMALVAADVHKVDCFCSKHVTGSREPIRNSVMRLSWEQTQSEAVKEARIKAELMLQPPMYALAVSPCLSFYHFVGFPEQFVLTGKCHTTLSALTAPPPPLHCPLCLFLHIFFFSLLICGMQSFFPPHFSHPIMSSIPLLLLLLPHTLPLCFKAETHKYSKWHETAPR